MTGTKIYFLIVFQNEGEGRKIVLLRRLGWKRTEVLLISAVGEEEENGDEDQGL